MVLMLIETAMIYPAPVRSNGDWQAEWLEHEDVYFESADGTKLHGWFCEHPEARRSILFCHGNGEHVAYVAEELEFLRNRYEANVMAFDYRGYGKSAGRPFEKGILADGEAAQNWLAERTGQSPDSIVLFGRSLGGAVAVHLAAKNGARGLILDRTFSSMVDVAASHFAWVPMRLLLRNRYPAASWIANYRGPLIQFHGKPDEIIPFQLGYALFESAASQEKLFIASETLTHNVPWPKEHYDELQLFLDSLPWSTPQEQF